MNLYQLTFGASKNIQRLYDSFPRTYEIALPSNNPDLRKMVGISAHGESAFVRVLVSPATEYRARIIWFIAIFTFLMVALGVAAVSGWMIWQSLPDWRFWVVMRLFGLSLLVLLPIGIHNLYGAVNLGDIGEHPNLTLLSYRVVFAPLRGLDESFYSAAWTLQVSYTLLLDVVMLMLGIAAAAMCSFPSGENATVQVACAIG